MIAPIKEAWIRVTSNRKQFGTLCGLVGLGLLLWARLIIASDMPKTAIAEPVDEPKQHDDAEDVASHNRNRERIDVALERQALRDPFVIDEERFPRPTPIALIAEDQPKSRAQPVEDPEQAKADRRLQVRMAVAAMKLEAVLPTANLAIIDGRRIRIGEAVETEAGQRLVVAEVRQRSVVLEAEGDRFELKMSIPGG